MILRAMLKASVLRRQDAPQDPSWLEDRVWARFCVEARAPAVPWWAHLPLMFPALVFFYALQAPGSWVLVGLWVGAFLLAFGVPVGVVAWSFWAKAPQHYRRIREQELRDLTGHERLLQATHQGPLSGAEMSWALGHVA